MIQLEEICFSYEEEPVVSYFSIDIKKGESILLNGPNGCGKTTILKIINGLLFAEYGDYYFEGDKVTKELLRDQQFSKWFHQQIGYVFQDSTIQLFCASVEEELSFAPEQMGLNSDEVTTRVEDVITLFELEKLRKRAPYTLSSGEKKKVAIASVLTANPSVLIFDEPFSGLDNKTVKKVQELLCQLQKMGKTMIITSHDPWAEEVLQARSVEMK
ncbi:MAG: ABC transporter ATP-binding protein [bacterium]|nr:ABC transporter ATP-binding protein [bacterium]